MNSFNLDDIREAAEEKYGSVDIEVGSEKVRLINALRLPKDRRNQLIELQDRLDSEEAEHDQEALLSDAIRIVAESTRQADILLRAVDGDLAVLAEIFERYSKGTQVGEASASHD